MKILFLSDATVSSVIRQELVAKELHKKYGHETYIYNLKQGVQKKQLEGYDAYFFIRPTKGVDQIIQGIRMYMPGKFIVVDQDDCFDEIPKTHIAYNLLGAGNPEQKDITRRCMAMADVVTVSTPQLKKYYSEFNPVVISNGWSLENEGWSKVIKKDSFVIGWAGTITHREDFKLAQQGIMDILNEFPQIKIVIGVDEEIYKRFTKIPEKQKVYVPMLTYPKYIYLVKSFNVLLAPLVNDKFNQFKSDIKLVEAGAACIPWVASPIENYKDWQLGGTITNDFYAGIKNYMNIIENITEGGIGYTKALDREMHNLVDEWNDILRR